MRVLLAIVMFFIAYSLQTTVFQYIQIGHSKPNLMVMLTIFFALVRGSIEGGIAGLIGGILMDLLARKVFGLYSLIGLYTGILVGNFNKRFYRDSYFVSLVFTFVFTFFYELLFYIINYFIWGETRIAFAIKHIILPETIYNCILAIPVYGIVIRVNNWLEQRGKKSRKY